VFSSPPGPTKDYPRVGWSTLVAAELIAATQGIGHFVMSASQFPATDYVFVVRDAGPRMMARAVEGAELSAAAQGVMITGAPTETRS
jgi:taurine transport system permease protein